jgi:hypothetical protein
MSESSGMQNVELEQVTLEKLKFGIIKYLTPEFLIDMVTVSNHIDFMADEIAIAVRGFVWGEKESAQHEEIEYPRNWKQAFKERWFPKWMLKRWPVQTTKIILDVRAIYPTFKPKVDGHEYRLIIQKMTSERIDNGPADNR